MSQCKAYKQLTNIHPDTYIDVIPVNCGNCQRWDTDIERCRDETVALNMNDPELRVGWVQDW
jgi:hypothetical protein